MDADLELKAEQLAGEIAAQAQTLDDLNGLFRCLMKSALERILDTEISSRPALPHAGSHANFATLVGHGGEVAVMTQCLGSQCLTTLTWATSPLRHCTGGLPPASSARS
jgi:hypothetical protein